ncbi:hypothetical protein D3C83_260790 [compost metagenome]
MVASPPVVTCPAIVTVVSVSAMPIASDGMTGTAVGLTNELARASKSPSASIVAPL